MLSDDSVAYRRLLQYLSFCRLGIVISQSTGISKQVAVA